MATFDNDALTNAQLPRRHRLLIILAILSPVLFALCFIALAWWIVSHMFTSPPPSVEHNPLTGDATNVTVVHKSYPDVGAPDVTITEYETAKPPADVYSFYNTVLVKDGWGGVGYFARPALTNDGMKFEWDEMGPNGCEELGYTLLVVAQQKDLNTTTVHLYLEKINPC